MLKLKWITSVVALLTIQSNGFAQSATWVGNVSSDLTDPSNWNGGLPTDTGYFQTGNTSPSLSTGETFTINTFSFPITAPNESFNFSLTGGLSGGATLFLQGTGVEVNNNQQQTFSVSGSGSALWFYNNSSAYTGTGSTAPIYNIEDQGYLNFYNLSTSGSSVINVSNDGSLNYYKESSAENAVINLSVSELNTYADSTLGNATIVQSDSYSSMGDDSSLDSVIFTSTGGSTLYYGSSVADSNATIILLNNSNFIVAPSGGSLSIASLSGDASATTSYDGVTFNVGSNNLSTTYAGTLNSSTGTFNKLGNGTFDFSGNVTGGTFNLMQGNLVLDGTINGTLTTSASTILSGSGRVIDGTGVTVGGIISPGNNIGTLTFVNTPFTQGSGSTYLAEVNGAGQSDLISLIGSPSDAIATIESNTTLSISSTDGTYRFNYPYTLLEAPGGIVGTYTNVIVQSSPFLVPTVSYVDGPTDLILLLTTDFSSGANQDNFCIASTIDALSSATPTPAQELLISAIAGLPNAGALNDAFYQLSGLPYTYVTQISEYTDFRFGRRLFNAVRDWIGIRECLPTSQVWVRGEYDHADVFGRHNVYKAHDNSGDISAGVHAFFHGDIVVGVAGNYSSDNVKFTHNWKSNELQTAQGAIYAIYDPSIIYIFTNLIIGETWANKFKRDVNFSTIENQLRSKINIFHGKYYAEAGWEGFFTTFALEPFIGGDVGWYNRNKITEKGAEELQRTIKAKSGSYGDFYVGTHFLVPACFFRITGDLFYQHRFGSFDNHLDGSFTTFGDTCSIASREFGRNGVVGNLNFSTCAANGLELYIELNGQGWENFASYGASLGLDFTW